MTAGSGSEALTLLSHHEFALAILDVRMPVMDGVEVAHIMQKDEHTQQVPIIFMTALSPDDQFVFEGYECGAVDYIFKPVDRETLKCKVNIFLKLYEQKQQLKKQFVELQSTHANLRKTKAQLAQSEKMACVGQLAAGIAHEISNPTGFVISNIDTLSGYCNNLKKLFGLYENLCSQQPHSEPYQRVVSAIATLKKEAKIDSILNDLDGIIKESMGGLVRIRDIVSNLKIFFPLAQDGVSETNVHQCIAATLKRINDENKYHCRIHQKFGNIPNIHCNSRQIGQVFSNILVNAVQATEDNGNITISTSTKDNNVLVRIEDDGKGIDPQDIDDIFNPFFTTKPVGEGTGLGLSISYGIVEKHGGNILVESQKDKGAVFTIVLPCNLGAECTENALLRA